MLSGIPEVDLGIEAKIKNIEATEEAKQKLLDQKNRKDNMPSHFVPNNIAVNFVQHNRCELMIAQDCVHLIADSIVSVNVVDSRKRRPQESSQQKPLNKEQKKKATDDYHYDKFRKQFRKH